MGYCLSLCSRSCSHEVPLSNSDDESPPHRRLHHLPKQQHRVPSRPPTQPNPPQYSFSTPSLPSSQIGRILGMPYVDITSMYDLDKELGRGQFGITYLCTEKATGFKGAFADEQKIHVVMELCSGGELFDRILARGSYSERKTASICRQIVNVVLACHFMGVMHKDLKPENFLLASRDEDAPIKATDFGLFVFIELG
ncbi:hypothetical protein LWI29_013712 [Acer saccharum]|uniref:Protein kinase domain-containing protein n=1 Tax=Acer saccharum TaxID=4024 RepID=A0AA39VFI1_ACESA|nr:hypothetical protein LWI29_013712 [Acer saccharum]